MSTNETTKKIQRTLSATKGGVPLIARDAWDARGLIDRANAVRDELAELESQLSRLIARSCEAADVTIDVTPMLFVDNEARDIVVKPADKQGEEDERIR